MMPEPSGDCWDGRGSWVSILIQVFLPLQGKSRLWAWGPHRALSSNSSGAEKHLGWDPHLACGSSGASGGQPRGSQPRSLTTQHGRHAFHTAFGSHTPVHLCPRVALPSLPCSASESWEEISQMLTEAPTSLGPSLFSRLPVHSFWN